MPNYTVTSELYSEFDYKTNKPPELIGNVVSEFSFLLPKNNAVICDSDGDLIIDRGYANKSIQIEHSVSTALPLVGLQVWRGALLLADLALHWGISGKLKTENVLELGAGTGLTSFIAAMFANKVVCTDVNIGGILDLIKQNAKRNKDLIEAEFSVFELDFTKELSDEIKNEISDVNVIFAADVIYDDTLTESFMNIIEQLLNTEQQRTILIALEKRFVFTIADFDSVAPCYETFLSLLEKLKNKNIHNKWTIEQVPIDFPQYFKYQRVKELVLWQIKC